MGPVGVAGEGLRGALPLKVVDVTVPIRVGEQQGAGVVPFSQQSLPSRPLPV